MALGEIFLRLCEGDRLADLCYAKKSDFANEALGLPPRTFFALCELAAGLRERLLLKEAVLSGEVSPLKARMVMEMAVGEREAAFTAAAMEMTLSELKELVKGGGEDGGDEPVSLRTLWFQMRPEQQDRLDYALSLAKEIVGYDAPRWRLTEAVAREWLAWGRGEEVEVAPKEKKDPDWLTEMTKRSNAVSRQLRAVFEAGEVISEGCCGVPEENALGLLAQARRLLRQRKQFDEPLGRVLTRIAESRLWWWLGFDNLADYCRERLGISASTARQRIRLERRLRKLPALRQALASGRLTYTKVLLVARHATSADVEERIAAAAKTTHQQVKEGVVREEDQKDREQGVRKETGPSAALKVVAEAIDSARRQFLALGEEIGRGEAQARIGDHFVKVWEIPLKRAEWRNKWQKDVLLRTGGLCAVPGCTRPARDLHHITFRSRGGPHAAFNCIGVCWFHHKRCIHKGLLEVRGRGGQRLVWQIRDQTLMTWAEWETLGDDEVQEVPLKELEVLV